RGDQRIAPATRRNPRRHQGQGSGESMRAARSQIRAGNSETGHGQGESSRTDETDLKMPDELTMRVHGDASMPTLVYLPGMHGDWTLVSSFRAAIAGRVRFVEFSYPRTATWSLDDYARGIEGMLLANRIERGWLLGEWFGSLS